MVTEEQIKFKYLVALNDNTMRIGLDDSAKQLSSDELLDRYRAKMLAEIGREIHLSINGERVSLEPTESELGHRHPIRFTCSYFAPLSPSSGPLNVQIQDRNYRDMRKSFRASCKSRPQEILTKCNVAPILVRTNLQELWKLSDEKRLELQTIMFALNCNSDPAIVSDEKTKNDSQTQSNNENASNNRSKWNIALLCLGVLLTVELIYFSYRTKQ